MSILKSDLTLKYEVQRPRGTDYEIYSFRKDSEGEWQYLECFITDMFGRVVEYDVWSDTLQEMIPVNVRIKSEYYKQKFSEVRDVLKLAIVEHECQKGVAL